MASFTTTFWLSDNTTIEHKIERAYTDPAGVYTINDNNDNTGNNTSLSTILNTVSKNDIVGITFNQVDNLAYQTIRLELAEDVFSGLINLRMIHIQKVLVGHTLIFDDNCFSECGTNNGGIELFIERPDYYAAGWKHLLISATAFQDTKINKIGFKQSEVGAGKVTFETGAENSNSGFKYELRPSQTVGAALKLYKDGSADSELIDSGQGFSFFGSTTAPLNLAFSEPPCFVAGTLIKTDQGLLPIEQITPDHSIRGNRVRRVTECFSNKNFVLIKKNAFGKNRPNKDTLSTHWHGIYLNDNDKEFVRLKDLINDKTVVKQKHSGYVYNVELKNKHTYMYANNLKVETLIPGHRGW